jgi:hypothetical protein
VSEFLAANAKQHELLAKHNRLLGDCKVQLRAASSIQVVAAMQT